MIHKERGPALITYSLFFTSIGWCGMLTAGRVLLRLYAGYPSRKDLLRYRVRGVGDTGYTVAAVGGVIDSIKRFCCGENVSFEDCVLDWSNVSCFQQKVLQATREVPYGSVETYGNLAVRIGCHRGARAVGNALAKNPFPLIIPCHRIVREGGRPGGFSAGGGVLLKKRLLRLEQMSSS